MPLKKRKETYNSTVRDKEEFKDDFSELYIIEGDVADDELQLHFEISKVFYKQKDAERFFKALILKYPNSEFSLNKKTRTLLALYV
jgi:hypothetical protein